MTGRTAHVVPRSRLLLALAATLVVLATVGVPPAFGGDNGPAVDSTYSIGDATATEGDQLMFPVTCEGVCTRDVEFWTSDGGPNPATAGTDYTEVPMATPQPLPFNGPGILFGVVDTTEDDEEEPDETLVGNIRLFTSGPLFRQEGGQVITPPPNAIGTILDDDDSGDDSPHFADLAVTKVDNPDPVQVGDTLIYTITVHNFGPAAAANVSMFDTLPAGVTFLNAFPTSPAQGSCSFNGTNLVTCAIGTIQRNATHSFEVHVMPTGPGTLQNTARASSTSTPDPKSANNTALADTVAVAGSAGGAIAALRGPRTCVWSEGTCEVVVECTNLQQDCTAVGGGRVLISGAPTSSAVVRIRRVRRTVPAGEERALKVRVKRRARRLIRRRLRRGARVRAKVRVVVTDDAGNRTVRRRTLRVR